MKLDRYRRALFMTELTGGGSGEGNGGHARTRRPFLLRAGNPLDWDSTDKVLLAGILVFPWTVWFWFWERYLMHGGIHAPYVNMEVLPRVFWLQKVLMAGWLAISLAALCVRRRSPHGQVLPFIGVQFYFLGFGTAAYFLGHYTTPFGAIVGFAGAVNLLLLFPGWIAISGIVSFVLLIGATTLLEQIGILPYSPMFVRGAFEGGHLSTAYLIYLGVPMFGIFGLGILLCYYILDRWRDRDERLARASEQIARANDIISRYVASQLADQVRRGEYDGLEGHYRRKLTLFFSDIQGFATAADEVEPEDLSEVLNEYLSEMTAIGERYGATIDKFVGDAIMIFFGAPDATNDRDQALRAVRMAIDMQRRMGALRQKWTHEGFERPFRIRIGINTGQATIGSFGSPGRMDYTAIGRQVNLAARLQVHCEAGRILLGHSTWTLVQDDVACVPKGEIQVKGFIRPVRVYEVADVSDEPVLAAGEASAE